MDNVISLNGYTDIFNNSPLAQLIISTDEPYYTILDVNRAYLHSTNTERSALIGKSVFAVFPANPTDEGSNNIERAKFSFNEVIQTKKPHMMSNYRYDIPIPGTTQFEERYWTTTNTPILGEDGNVMFFIHSPSKVNARHQLEEAEERARLALEAVDLGTFDLNLLNGEMITSIRFANIFGFEKPVTRDDYVKVFHRDDRKLRTDSHIEALKKGTLFYEARVIWKDKSVHWVKVEGKVYYAENGVAYRILGTLLDITEEKKSLAQQLKLKQALAESEHLLKKITSASPACLFMCNENGAITYVNQTWIDWTGLSYNENMVSGWLDAIYFEDRKKAISEFLETLTTHTLYDVEFRINHVDGTLHWCVASGQPQYRSDDSFSGYIGSCTDITEQKELQQQKDAFIGIASHELKTPVTSIKAYTQVMEKMLLKKGEMVEARMMRKMDSQLDRLTSLINDLLDVTKINSGKLQFNQQEFNFELLIKDLVEDLQRTTETHRLIEKYSPTGIVFADKERIGQVVTNLITNAIKYSPNAKEIIISTSLKDQEVTVQVEDFGVGISLEDQSKVFEQFYRVNGEMQHTFAGLGLGLYISSEIIKREGGKIWVESIKDKGSIFCFCIPVQKELALNSI
jgi:PAS domain S-box-containing protein